MNFKSFIAICVIALTTPAFARDNIQITGSSTVYPFVALSAQNFSDIYSAPSPVIESIGTGAGVKIFCGGIGEDSPDIVNASRPLKKDEAEICTTNGVDAVEIKIGYDGIVFASDVNGPDFNFTAKDIYLAMAANLVIDGQLVPNPYTKWNEINPAFPDWTISAFIPGEKHGTREVFDEKLLLVGCDKDALKSVNVADEDIKKTCISVRKDGFISDIDGHYTETLARLNADKTAIGVFGISFYEANTDKIKVATVDGVVPSIETVSTSEYPVSRPLFVYVKQQHIGLIPNLKEFLIELVSDSAIGSDGYLVDLGLVPMPEDQLIETQLKVDNL